MNYKILNMYINIFFRRSTTSADAICGLFDMGQIRLARNRFLNSRLSNVEVYIGTITRDN